MVFDHRLFKDDVSTPISYTTHPATVIQWYGRRASRLIGGGVYESLIDVEFDYRPGEVSKGHFTDHLRILSEE